MLAALDVAYDDPAGRAVAAAVLFEDWAAPAAVLVETAVVAGLAPYQPGAFFER
jgi:deoxyinosine 3'endonuclease (endonuclease V)